MSATDPAATSSWPRRYRYRYTEAGDPEGYSGAVLIHSREEAEQVDERLRALHQQDVIAGYEWEYGEPVWPDAAAFLATLPVAEDEEAG
ncbi:MAG: hypothetical protein ACYC6M_08810 [Terriglobales bacterium]